VSRNARLIQYTFSWIPVADAVPLLEVNQTSLLVDPVTNTLLISPIPYAEVASRRVSHNDLQKVNVVSNNRLISALVIITHLVI
jgi:hypothetical protein